MNGKRPLQLAGGLSGLPRSARGLCVWFVASFEPIMRLGIDDLAFTALPAFTAALNRARGWESMDKKIWQAEGLSACQI